MRRPPAGGMGGAPDCNAARAGASSAATCAAMFGMNTTWEGIQNMLYRYRHYK
jgi:hypothetical protein